MSALCFRVTAADGRTATGPIQGAGGMVECGTIGTPLERIQCDARRADNGLRLSIFEPTPGYCRIFPDYSAAGNGEPVDLPLPGAVVELA